MLTTPVFVISAPSGGGKTTLNRRLIAEHPEVEISISYTTREKRAGEVEGVHYHYVTPDHFRELIAHGEMLEHAEVFGGTLYGTPVAELRRIGGAGRTALLEIDVQGWRQAHAKLPQARSVFILPPSIEALWERLERRGTEPVATRWRRLMTARHELEAGPIYDGFIVNHDLDAAYAELQAIIITGAAPKIGPEAGGQLCQALLAEFDQAPWLRRLASALGHG